MLRNVHFLQMICLGRLNDNLEGYDRSGDAHVFTWQPHGSQFTIIENVPEHGNDNQHTCNPEL